MSGFVYAIQVDGLPIYKVGNTHNPMERIGVLSGQTPHALSFALVMDVGCFLRAKVFEAYALAWLSPFKSHGEWVTDLDAIRDVFSTFCPAVDVTDEVNALIEPRKPPRMVKPKEFKWLERQLAEADRKAADPREWYFYKVRGDRPHPLYGASDQECQQPFHNTNM